MANSITVHLQIFNRPQLLHFSTDLGETGIKIHGLLKYFLYNIAIIRVAIPFNRIYIPNSRKLVFILFISGLYLNPPGGFYLRAELKKLRRYCTKLLKLIRLNYRRKYLMKTPWMQDGHKVNYGICLDLERWQYEHW